MNKVKRVFNKIRSSVITYFFTNRLFLSYVFLSLIACILLRAFTIGRFYYFRPLVADIGVIVALGSFGYFLKPNKQYHYFMTVLCFICPFKQ